MSETNQGDYIDVQWSEPPIGFQEEPIDAQVVDAPNQRTPMSAAVRAQRQPRRWVALPLGLFVFTWVSTFLAGGLVEGLSVAQQSGWMAGLLAGLARGAWFAVPVMTILICHEMGHFLQARRWGVYASYPFFIPMPFSPFGTLGAVIAMEPRMGNRRALFDIGVTGPLAGLVPTLIFCVVGLSWSTYAVPSPEVFLVGDPPLFRLLAHLVIDGPRPPGTEIAVHPMAFAGWVGMFITALNLIPIGQLDGGHVLYALLRNRAHAVASLLLFGATAMVVLYFEQYHMWLVMILLLMAIGPNHPPTSDDEAPIGPVRTLLGWATLSFVLVGFTPTPIVM